MRFHKTAYVEYQGKQLEQMEDSADKFELANSASEEYKCEPCRTTFSDEKTWVRHMQRHKVPIRAKS